MHLNYAGRVSLRLASIVGAIALLAAGCDKEPGKGDGHDSLPHGSTAAEGHDDHEHGSTAEALSAHTHTTRLEFSTEPAALPSAKPATWTLKIVDQKSGEPVKEFDTVHEKLLHLIIISTDLSWFNHIHPVYQGNGVFTVNTVLPREGSYKLYADYTPKGGTQEVAQHEFATGGGQPTPTSVLPVVDSLGDDVWIVKSVSSAPEGEPEYKGGDAYQVALMPMPSKITAGQDVMLHFQVRDKSGKPVSALEPYLGAMGHCVILSSDTKIYLHTHPMDGGDHGSMDHGSMNHGSKDQGSGSQSSSTGGGQSGSTGAGGASGDAAKSGSDVIFHTNFPAPGLYKVWGQFQHNGKIITAPFVLNVGA